MNYAGRVPIAVIVTCQSVAGRSLEYSCRIVGVYVSAHGHVVSAEVGVNGGCSLVAVCRERYVYRRRYLRSSYVETVVKVSFLVHTELFFGNVSLQCYASHAVGRVYVAVVECGLQYSIAAIYRYEVCTLGHKVGGSVVERDA